MNCPAAQQRGIKALNTESAVVDESATNMIPEPLDRPQTTAIQSAPFAEQTKEGNGSH